MLTNKSSRTERSHHASLVGTTSNLTENRQVNSPVHWTGYGVIKENRNADYKSPRILGVGTTSILNGTQTVQSETHCLGSNPMELSLCSTYISLSSYTYSFLN